MLRDAVANLPGEIQASTVVFEQVDDPQALLVVVEPAWHQSVEDAFACVPERCVAEIVAEGNCLGQFLVKAEYFRDRARDLRDLEGVGQTGTVMVAGWREEDL